MKNLVQLTGKAGIDPDVRTFESGNEKCSFSLAVTETFRNRQGEKISETSWHRLVAWGKVAQEVKEKVKKGSIVSIQGRLNNRTYQDKTGMTRYITEIVLSEVTVVENNEEVTVRTENESLPF